MGDIFENVDVTRVTKLLLTSADPPEAPSAAGSTSCSTYTTLGEKTFATTPSGHRRTVVAEGGVDHSDGGASPVRTTRIQDDRDAAFSPSTLVGERLTTSTMHAGNLLDPCTPSKRVEDNDTLFASSTCGEDTQTSFRQAADEPSSCASCRRHDDEDPACKDPSPDTNKQHQTCHHPTASCPSNTDSTAANTTQTKMVFIQRPDRTGFANQQRSSPHLPRASPSLSLGYPQRPARAVSSDGTARSFPESPGVGGGGGSQGGPVPERIRAVRLSGSPVMDGWTTSHHAPLSVTDRVRVVSGIVSLRYTKYSISFTTYVSINPKDKDKRASNNHLDIDMLTRTP
ncbi:hypothetical protein ACOMHN_063396 [Nucella lapillus]